MKDTAGILNLPQREFNRQILKLIEEGANGDTDALETAITALENAVGDNKKGLTKKVNDLETRIKALEDAA